MNNSNIKIMDLTEDTTTVMDQVDSEVEDTKPTYWRQIIFGGCGGMYNYCLGVAAIIQDHFGERDENGRIIIPGTVFSGSSAGCFPALVLALGLNVRELFETWNIPMLKDVRQSCLKALFRWNHIVREHTMQHLHDNAYSELSGIFNVSLTRVYPWQNELVSNFLSNQDLLDAIMASAHIPFIFGTGVTTLFRGHRYIDGSITNSEPIHPNINQSASILVRYDRWRSVKMSWLWCSSNENWTRYQFQLGQNDAIANLTEFLAPLHQPRSIDVNAVGHHDGNDDRNDDE